MNDNLLKQETILLVDDNPDNLQVLYQTLQTLGCKIIIAKNGSDALELVIKMHPALILLDIMMPEIDGFEVLKEIKSNPDTNDIAVIFLSALDDVEHKVKGLKLGAVDYISKPFKTQEVMARVINHLKIITLEKKLNELNRQLNEDNIQILQSMGEGLIKLNQQGQITYVNPAAIKITGWSQKRIIGSDFHQSLQHSDHEGKRLPISHSNILKALNESSAYISDSEVFWRYQDKAIPVEYSVTSFILNDEKSAFIVFRDITLRKENEQALANALSEVKKLQLKLQAENVYLQQEIKQGQNFCGIVGESEALKKVLTEVEQVAATDSTVLIYGESGTGKEAIARAIHEFSLRKDRPLIKVNCGAIPESLVESELFGHVKGAFTSAVNDRTGHFELADGGTIFLDEIGELSLEIQVKLLRVLQEKEIQMVGSETVKKVDVRFIAATNRDLTVMVEENEFRMDLFYRLNVFPIHLPPLRERLSDIPLLAGSFLNQLSRKLNKVIAAISADSLQRLQSYHWPGNIRELQNVLERSAILAQSEIIEIDDKLLPQSEKAAQPEKVSLSDFEQYNQKFEPVSLAENERRYILQVVQKFNWLIGGKEGAAEALGLPASTLRSKMKKLGIQKQ